MNIFCITADTCYRDHMAAYGHKIFWTPALDELAAKGTQFDCRYAGGTPTIPTRADLAADSWAKSFMSWELRPAEGITLERFPADNGYHTAVAVDTPFHIRGMNYDRDYQSLFFHPVQEGFADTGAAGGAPEVRCPYEWWGPVFKR